jgi:mono/diheme cytochrome c family protein
LRFVQLLFFLLAINLLGTPLSAAAESASNLYLLNCWGCHGSHGEGIKGTAPSLIGLGDFLQASGGRAYLVEVPGVALSALSDAQIATVMNWVLDTMSKNNLPRDFVPYSADEVHRYRAVRLAELSRTRRALIDQLVAMKVRAPAE